MNADEILGLTVAQHKEIGEHLIEARHPPRPMAGVASRPKQSNKSAARVMFIDDGYAVYSPRKPRKVAVFHLNRIEQTKTIEMFGTNLSGDLIVTIAGVDYVTDCRSSTATLRAVFAPFVQDCRITAFPGMWEFAWTGDAPEMSVRPGLILHDRGYTGGVLLVDEAWRSEDNGNGGFVTIDGTDAMPFIEGEIRRGSRAIAHWTRRDGWLIGDWKCRAFSFRAEV